MAYAYSISVYRVPVAGGGRRWSIRIVETGVSNGDEWQLSSAQAAVSDLGCPPARETLMIPEVGVIRDFKCEHRSGTGTTVQPRLGARALWSDGTVDEILTTSPAAAWHHYSAAVLYALHGGQLRGESGVDAGSDNEVVTSFVLEEAIP